MASHKGVEVEVRIRSMDQHVSTVRRIRAGVSTMSALYPVHRSLLIMNPAVLKIPRTA